jgi:hypothetical protein
MEERLYDLIFICRPATPEEEISKIVATLEHSAAENRKVGHAPAGLSRVEAPRGFFRIHGASQRAERHYQGARTAPESFRRRHQVSNRSSGRRFEAPAETHPSSRAPRQPPPAQDGSSAGSAAAGSTRRRTNGGQLTDAGSPFTLQPRSKAWSSPGIERKEIRCPMSR